MVSDEELERIRRKKMEELLKMTEKKGGEKVMEEKIVNVCDGNFDSEVLRSEEPVLVDFWAEWCMPCHMLAPVIEKVAKEFSVKLCKLNVDFCRETAMKYGIMSIPTVLLFKNGEPVDGFVGAMPEKAVREWLQKALAK